MIARQGRSVPRPIGWACFLKQYRLSLLDSLPSFGNRGQLLLPAEFGPTKSTTSPIRFWLNRGNNTPKCGIPKLELDQPSRPFFS
jgi:hypothetical protein